MAVTEGHTIYAVDIDGTLIDQVQDLSIDPSLNRITIGGDGQVYNTFTAVGSQKPRLTFTTTAIATALAKVGGVGFKLTTGDVATLYTQTLAEGSTRAGATSHLKMVINEGLIVPRTLNIPHEGHATITYEILTTYNGTNDPIVLTDGQSLAGSPSTGELFTAGPMKINGSGVEGVQNVTYNFGIDARTMGGDGQVWDTFAYIMGIDPSWQATFTKRLPIAVANWLAGLAQSGSASLLYLRKIAEGGTRVTDVTAEHISLTNTVSEGHHGVVGLSGSHDGGPMVTTLDVALTSSNGTTAPVAISTATAIT